MAKDFDIAVVIPAYNAETYIERALNSVLSQTYAVSEIIVVDDGSTDQTAEKVKNYNERVNYIYQRNAGASAARNNGIKASTCNWIAFLDADDEWLPRKIELQVRVLQKNKDLVWVSCNYYLKDPQSDECRVFMNTVRCRELLDGKDFFEDWFEAALQALKWNPLSILIKKTSILKAGLFCEKLVNGEDLDMWLRMACLWPNIGFVNQPLAYWYYGNIGSFTKETSYEDKIKYIFDFFDRQNKLFSANRSPHNFGKFIKYKIHHLVVQLYLDRKSFLIPIVFNRYGEWIIWYKKVAIRLLIMPMIRNIHFPRLIYKICRP